MMSRIPLKRTPLKSKRSKPRRLPAVVCKFQRCRTRPRAAGLCRTHLAREADRVFSLWIRRRDGHCVECGTDRMLQCAHLISRGARYIRFDPENAVTLCSRDHQRYTLRPGEWAVWMARHAPGRHDSLALREAQGQALGGDIDYVAVIERFGSDVAA